jgi:hypothetical protein
LPAIKSSHENNLNCDANFFITQTQAPVISQGSHSKEFVGHACALLAATAVKANERKTSKIFLF